MERAAAGEIFHVSRRGRPYVQLSPAELRMDVEAA
jgi:antitoxin (DNA-binding transcriptional repressor) of toxin-antitoxin stability system